MSRSRGKVRDWIKDSFEENSVELKDFPILPGGTLIKDNQGGEMLAFWDIETHQVKYFIRENKK